MNMNLDTNDATGKLMLQIIGLHNDPVDRSRIGCMSTFCFAKRIPDERFCLTKTLLAIPYT
jgi:hypothetical protein